MMVIENQLHGLFWCSIELKKNFVFFFFFNYGDIILISDTIHLKIYLKSGYPPSPIRWWSRGNLFAEVANSSEFLKTLESCTEPGQPAKTSVSTMLLSHTICEGMGNLQINFIYFIMFYIFMQILQHSLINSIPQKKY